jgi:4-hydroxybenzoate polyprenyltransferase/phosphoserine phosphatase
MTNTAARVLCVDLDETLIHTDVCVEVFLQSLIQAPSTLFRFPLWLLQGRAVFKHRMAELVQLDPVALPYREDVLAFLREERKSGRRLYLVTAADERHAQSIAEHLDLFEGWMASDGTRNLKGRAKAQALEERFGARNFDYIGNGLEDLPVWRSAGAALAVTRSSRLLRRIEKNTPVSKVFATSPWNAARLGRLLRAHQWIKNLLLAVPAIFAQQLSDRTVLWRLAWGFLALSACTSAVYLFNDMCDIPSDRRHPGRQNRPLVRGDITPQGALVFCALLFLASEALSYALSGMFALGLGVYFAANVAYSLYLKKRVLIDVFFLGCVYSSSWLLAFSMFLFVGLAFAKRYIDLQLWTSRNQILAQQRGYQKEDSSLLCSMGIASGYISSLVLALYISSSKVTELYRHPDYLWAVCLLLLYWISRFWLMASRGKVSSDPVLFAVNDHTSRVIGLLMAITVFWAA